MNRRVIHFDLDGVLADFRKGFAVNHGFSPDGLSADELWARVAATPEFFLRLDVLESGQRLFAIAKSLGEVRVLIALPRKTSYAAAEEEKRRWTETNIGADVPFVAVQFASQKEKFAMAGDILIDDSEENIRRWVRAGGIGIVHTGFDISVSSLLAAFNMNRDDCIQRASALNLQLQAVKRFDDPDRSEEHLWSSVVDQDTNRCAWYPKDKMDEYWNWLSLRFILQ